MPTCKLTECSKNAMRKRVPSYCEAHYARNRRYGSPTKGGRPHVSLRATIQAPQVPDLTKAYWAGFFDGEGSVGIYKSKTHYQWRATISQNTPHTRVLRDIRDTYGGSVSRSKTRPIECLQLSTLKAYAFLRDILPYCTIKNKQILLFIQAVDSVRSGGTMDVSEACDRIAAMKKER